MIWIKYVPIQDEPSLLWIFRTLGMFESLSFLSKLGVLFMTWRINWCSKVRISSRSWFNKNALTFNENEDLVGDALKRVNSRSLLFHKTCLLFIFLYIQLRRRFIRALMSLTKKPFNILLSQTKLCNPFEIQLSNFILFTNQIMKISLHYK